MLFAAVLVTSAPAQQRAITDEDVVAAWFSAAQVAKAKGDLAGAEAGYRKVLRARPGLVEAHSNLGLVYYLQGRCGDAVEQFGRALRLRPALDIPLLFSGICHHQMQRFERAIPLLEQAASSAAPKPEAFLYLGLSYSALKQESRANHWFQKYAAKNPNGPEALYQLGGSYLRLSSEHFDAASEPFLFVRTQAELGELQNRPAAAVRARYEEAIALKPSYPNLYWRLARVLLRSGDPAGARIALEREIKVQPEHLPALLLAAELDRRAGEVAREQDNVRRIADVAYRMPRNDAEFTVLVAQQRRRAASLLNALVEVSELPEQPRTQLPGSPALSGLTGSLGALRVSLRNDTADDWALEVYSRARMVRAEWDLLRGELEALMGRQPERQMLRYLLGNLYYRLSLATYTRMAELDPAGYRTLLLRAETLEQLHLDDDAEQAYRAVLARRPNMRDIHYRLGALLLRRRKLAEAAAEFERELAIDRSHQVASIALAEVHIEQNRLDTAVALLRRVIEQDPEARTALLALARAYLQQSKPAEAAPMFERALKLRADDVAAHYQLAQTYQELGQQADAQREFDLVRTLRARQKPSRPSAPSTATPR